MAKIAIGLFIVASVLSVAVAVGRYSPPLAKVEPLRPRGIRISVPDEDGISLVAFHVKFNEDFNGLEAGEIARDIVRAKNGRWTYEDRTTRLRTGDIIYYWVHVVYDGLGYNLLDQQHQVSAFYDVDGHEVNTGPSTPPPTGNGVGCAPTDTQVIDMQTGGRKTVCAGELLLQEDFDRLNTSRWRQVEMFPAAPDYEFVVYRNNERNVKLNNGNLQITPTLVEPELGQDYVRHGTLNLERCTAARNSNDCQREARGAYILPPVFSGLVDTRDSFAFIYGKIEIRAKLPRGDWIYPIISLKPVEAVSTYSSTVMFPELRIASAVGNSVLVAPGGKELSGRVLYGGAFETTPGSPRSESIPTRYSTKLWSDDYHTYELEWRRDRITSRVDGITYGSTENRVPFDRPFYLSLGVAVGGHNEFPDLASSGSYVKPWRNVGSKALFDFFNSTELWTRSWINDNTNMKIDYVKIWAL